MEFSELTNKELKGILRENQVKNYSNLNKKELVKKVKQLTREQNGGKSGKGKNGKKKKYTLKDLFGGDPPEMPTGVNKKNLPNFLNIPLTPPHPPPPRSPIPPPKNQALSNSTVATGSSQNSAPLNPIVATAPPLSQSQTQKQENREFNRQTNEAKRASLVTQPSIQPSNQVNTKKNNECGPCSIQ